MESPHLLRTSKYDPKVLEGISYFLPILYVAWSDSLLTAKELEAIRAQLNQQEWLTEEERKWLEQWLNPAQPPSPIDLKNWLIIIQRHIGKRNEALKLDLTQLGVEMADIGAEGHQKARKKDEIYAALKQIEDLLGVMGNEAVNQFNPIEEQEIPCEQCFDISKMTQLLDGAQAPIIEEVKTLLSSDDFQLKHYTDKEVHREQVYKWCKLLADQGYGSMAYPKAYGGQDRMEDYFAVMETLSYFDLSLVIKFGVQFGLWGMSIMLLGTQKHHEKYLAGTGKLEIPGCFAMTETGHGSNVRDLETTATFDRATQEFIIHSPTASAGKEYIGNAALHGHYAVVFAKLILDELDFGVSAFVVPIRNTDGTSLDHVRIEDCGDKLGLNGVDNGRIWFNQVRIPRDNMLDRFASVGENGFFHSPIPGDGKRFFTMLGTLVGGRIGIPRSGLSAAKKGLTIAIKYGDRRRQFGPAGKPEVPILNYQTHQRKLMPLLANVYAQHFALQYLTQRYVNKTEEEAKEVEALAAGLKAFATWNTTHTLQTCREACGGKGYLAENMLADLKADTDIYTTFEGDNTVLMQLVAKSLLTEFRQEFNDMNVFGLVKFVAERAELSFWEKNPIVIRKIAKDHLIDPDFHLSLFKSRERDQLISVAQRLSKLMKETDSFTAFNECQQHLVNLAQAHIERLVLEQFIEKLNTIEESREKEILTKVYQLYAIHQIDINKGWFLENDYMEGRKSKAIRSLLSDLCAEVREYALDLVDAFQIPKSCLPELIY